jgi:hypothetical protein
MLCAIAAVTLAALTRMPSDKPGSPSIADALDYANRYTEGESAKVKFLGQLHMASVGWRQACLTKSKLLVSATVAYLLALWLLLIPVVLAGIDRFSPAPIANPAAQVGRVERRSPPEAPALPAAERKAQEADKQGHDQGRNR